MDLDQATRLVAQKPRERQYDLAMNLSEQLTDQELNRLAVLAVKIKRAKGHVADFPLDNEATRYLASLAILWQVRGLVVIVRNFFYLPQWELEMERFCGIH